MDGLRILVVAHDHPDWTPGGTEFVAHGLATALDAVAGVSARFLAAATRLHRPDAVPGSLQAMGRDFVLVTGGYDRFTMLRQDGDAWLDSLARVLGTVRPDIVHLHGLDRLGAEIVPALRRLAPDVRIVLTLHDYQVICAQEGLMLTHEGAPCAGASPDRCHRCLPAIPAARHALRRSHLMAILNMVDGLVTPGPFLRDRLVDWGIAPARITVIPNGVPPAAPAPDAPRARRNRFAMFGNLARHKGALVLLAAAARSDLRAAGLEVTLHGGLGWAEDAFRADVARALEAARPVAQHLGPYPRAEVTARMRRADWVVVPSLWAEVAPLVILEAQAAGRPVICSGIGGMADMVTDGVDGLHVPPGDAHALAETLVRVADDTALWDRMATAAAARVARDPVAAHLALYRDLARQVAA
ncbi:MAG: glycosyltransferase [Rhodobacteraceae bacterium]|jgi:glycosyltransferase involved in cell wall biosynthesis|nr:glycosyltransferase [Paracoccaceae bacterium]